MTYRLSDALRRADLSLAGALFLGLATAAAWAVHTPTQLANVSPEPKFRPAILETAGTAQVSLPVAPLAPEVIPAPRPTPILSRLHIEVALANLASETSCLAEAIYYEARGEGMLGERAIAEVVVRRTHRAGFPHSICGVVHQGVGTSCQFSFVCDGTLDRPKAVGEWRRAVGLATRIITGAVPLTNLTDGAISFHAARIEANWPGLVRTVQIGNHVFYRRPAHNRPI
jgi:spore germination cell wall hydrolase CwlJ-like protein